MYIDVVLNMIKYWHRLRHTDQGQNFLIRQAYACYLQLHTQRKNNWLSTVHYIMEELGLNSFLINPQSVSSANLIKIAKKLLEQRFREKWRLAITSETGVRPNQGNKLRSYRLFKMQFNKAPVTPGLRRLTIACDG